MELVECMKDELPRLNLELNWSMAVKIFKIEINGKIVGLIDYSEGMYEKNSIHIDNFEVLEKGNGIGSSIARGIMAVL